MVKVVAVIPELKEHGGQSAEQTAREGSVMMDPEVEPQTPHEDRVSGAADHSEGEGEARISEPAGGTLTSHQAIQRRRQCQLAGTMLPQRLTAHAQAAGA